MAPATPAPRMRSLLAALTMASTSMSVMSPNWMRMRSVRRGMEGIVEQLRGDRWSDGRLIGISDIRYQRSGGGFSQEQMSLQSGSTAKAEARERLRYSPPKEFSFGELAIGGFVKAEENLGATNQKRAAN